MSIARIKEVLNDSFVRESISNSTYIIAPMAALSTFTCAMLSGNNFKESLISSAITASHGPLLGAVRGSFFHSQGVMKHAIDCPIMGASELSFSSLLCSQAMFSLINILVDLPITNSSFLNYNISGFLALYITAVLCDDLNEKNNMINGEKNSFILGLCG